MYYDLSCASLNLAMESLMKNLNWTSLGNDKKIIIWILYHKNIAYKKIVKKWSKSSAFKSLFLKNLTELNKSYRKCG
jgi:hypothetical protein